MGTETTREQLLEQYRRGTETIRDKVDGMKDDLLNYRPFAEAWTIAEHVNHLLDSEVNAFIRYRKAVAQPGEPVSTYEEEIWAQKLNYATQDMETSLDAFTMLREITYNHLSKIVKKDWSAFWYNHPERGKVTLEDWLGIYAAHVGVHMEYIERNERLFHEKTGTK